MDKPPAKYKIVLYAAPTIFAPLSDSRNHGSPHSNIGI